MKEKALCRWFGPAKNVGQAISYNILIYHNDKVSVLCISSVVPVPKETKYFHADTPESIYGTAFRDTMDMDDNAPSWYDDYML